VTLEFTIDNTSPVSGATDISFSDDLDDVLSGLAATGLPLSDVCGVGSSLTGLSGNTLLVFQDGSLLVGESCTFSVTLQVPAGAASGAYLNTTQGFSATVESTPVAFDDASDSLVVDSTKLLLAKSFTDDPVAPGEAATLEFTLTNLDASEDVTGIAFSDDLDAALSGLAATGLPMNDVCGAGSQISGTGVLGLTGGSLAPGASCSFSVDVVVPLAVPLGTVATNTTSGVTGTMGGLAVTGDPASDQLQIEFLTFAKAFDAPTVAGGTAMLTFTLQNLSATTGVGELGFTDDLSAVLPGLAAVGLPADDVCGAGSQLTGTSFLTLTAGTLGPSEMCSFGVTVQVPPGAAPGSFTNVTSSLLSAGLAAAAPAMAALIVEPPPAFAKSFAPDSIDVGDTSTLSFTIDNSASALAAAGLDFTDVLPAGVVVANPANAATTCTGGTLTAVAGSDAVSYSGGAVAAGAACGVSVDVVGSMAGVHVNTTGDLTSSSGNSGTATDTLTVNDVTPPRVVSVDSVLGTGDGQLAECEGARVELTQLLVSFDEPMSDPPGDTDLNDVTNPANYLLVGAGPDGDFATTGCGPAQGDDLAVAITGAAYAAGSSTATLSLGVAPALRDDLYRLFVCSELQDLGGNQLDGDGNGLEGDDFVRLFRMERTNSLVNGHFDCDLEGWDLTAADPGDITWDANDADGSAASGSAHVTNLTGSPAFEVSQCVPASASRLPLSGAVRVDSESVTATLLCRAYSEPACAGTLLDTAVVGSVALGKGGTAGVWEALSGELVTPAGTQSARCGVEVIAGTGAAFDVFVDSLVLGSRLPDFKVFRAANPPATPDERSRPAGAEPGATGEVTPR
jgi:hypothetical protein